MQHAARIGDNSVRTILDTLVELEMIGTLHNVRCGRITVRPKKGIARAYVFLHPVFGNVFEAGRPVSEKAGATVGLACSSGVYVDGKLKATGTYSGIYGSMLALSDARIDTAVLEVSRGGLITNGLPFDACDVGVCLNVANDHIGEDGIDSLDAMAVLKLKILSDFVGMGSIPRPRVDFFP